MFYWINYSLTRPNRRKVLLHVFLAVPLAGGLILQLPYCLGKYYFAPRTSKSTCNKTLRQSGWVALIQSPSLTCRIVVPFAKESESGEAVAPDSFVAAVWVEICVVADGAAVVIASRLFASRLKSV